MAKNMRFMIIALLTACAAGAHAQVAVSTTPVLTVDQVYKPVNPRDPLIPATMFGDQKGGGKAAKAEASSQQVAKGSFTVYGLTLTGILEDSRGRQALLRDQVTGLLYTLKAGHLVDSKKKTVPGVSGLVKGKQVILMTEDKKVHQLNLREKE
ncbi:MAG: hypothetical protein A2X35_04535 [Elusimicrobia bacterium GWA2_61_42]|nr:MAG: hypothetical protein A2X35_04535 [Elusimicrobia bacterium GWA2_61_42]OGR76608.1 MAG: hypothetical protein A2X38_03450 [Elusimicrobia bacterium GWC2_61_25]